MLFQVKHTTRYIYEAPVSHSLNEVRLTPRTLADQNVQKTGIRVQPEPAFIHGRKDYYDNDVTSFELFEKHEHLEITSESMVEVKSGAGGPPPPMSWNDAQAAIAAQSDDATIAASEFIYNSPHVSVTPQLDEYARATFVAGRPLLEAVQDLTHRIHADFKYRPQSTSISTPLVEVMKIRRGVCQDFAHVMIGALRSQRLAARYVSGYVRPGPKVQGAQASHAWVSVFFPGTGWLGFDPTNDLMVSNSHITLAWGRDYADVTPVKGISLGGGSQTVEVEVYVQPLAPLAPLTDEQDLPPAAGT
jgi:transglutaminase-like putative cysteine protease